MLLDNAGIIFRGDKPVDTAPAAQLGHALADLIRGMLPAAPQGQEWYYGVPDGPRTFPIPAEWPHEKQLDWMRRSDPSA
jgi:hypothetical protein